MIETTLKDDEALDNLFKNHDSVEVMSHPAYLDKELLASSSFTFPRVDELEFLTDEEIVTRVRSRKDIQLVTYQSI